MLPHRTPGPWESSLLKQTNTEHQQLNFRHNFHRKKNTGLLTIGLIIREVIVSFWVKTGEMRAFVWDKHGCQFHRVAKQLRSQRNLKG